MAEAAILQGLLDDAHERNALLIEQLSRRTFERDTLIQRIRFSYDHGGAFISTSVDDPKNSTLPSPPPTEETEQ